MEREPILACSVRGCGEPLVRAEKAWRCARGHGFDVARSGYVNLLQPQDRRSLQAGDSRAAVAARGRLEAAGIGAGFNAELAALADGLALAPRAVVVDLGSGTGATLAALAAGRELTGIGIDLASAAAEHAARLHPALTWVVANADRRLPLLYGSVDLVLSIHGRRNPLECARVLRPLGHLLAALPAADDLVELRAHVQGRGDERARDAAFLAEHEPFFDLRERRTWRERRRLARPLLLDLLAGTYRGLRASAAAAVATLDELEVTLAAELFLMRRK